MIKRLLRWLLGDVGLWRVYRWDATDAKVDIAASAVVCHHVDALAVSSLPDSLLAEQAWYCGDGASGFAAANDDDAIVGLCFHWYGRRYSLQRFWPLQDGEAMIVQIVTTPAARGRGVARALIQHSAHAMAARGMRTLWARVWVTNTPSSAAFLAAGWRQVAWVLEFNPLRRGEPWRIRWQ